MLINSFNHISLSQSLTPLTHLLLYDILSCPILSYPPLLYTPLLSIPFTPPSTQPLRTLYYSPSLPPPLISLLSSPYFPPPPISFLSRRTLFVIVSSRKPKNLLHIYYLIVNV